MFNRDERALMLRACVLKKHAGAKRQNISAVAEADGDLGPHLELMPTQASGCQSGCTQGEGSHWRRAAAALESTLSLAARSAQVQGREARALPTVTPRERTSHHVRELCPYITQEAHERQKPAPVGIVEDGLLKELKIGDHLLLKNGRRDFLTLVTKIEGQYGDISP